MSRVVIVGGGLSGLAAAALLEQQKIDYTLIEVKRRIGGSLISQEVNGFLFDGKGFLAHSSVMDHPLIEAWGLRDEFITQKTFTFFQRGAQSFIDALSARVTGPRLMRMAVSSIGDLEGGSMALCLENGLMLNARAIILALPARYAERIFYGYHTEITEHLLPYAYEPLTRVSIGYRDESLSLRLPSLAEYPFSVSARLPQRGGFVMQVGVPSIGRAMTPDEIEALCLKQQWPPPDAAWSHYWSESDPVYKPDYAAWRESLMAMLPPRVALIGSDYTPYEVSRNTAPLSDCLTQAQNAVNKILSEL